MIQGLVLTALLSLPIRTLSRCQSELPTPEQTLTLTAYKYSLLSLSCASKVASREHSFDGVG